MKVSLKCLITLLLSVYIHSGHSAHSESDINDCTKEGCTRHNHKILARTKRENNNEFIQRICSPNKKWQENEKSCVCSADGLKIICSENEGTSRRKRSIRKKRSNCCGNNNQNTNPPNRGYAGFRGNCCPPNPVPAGFGGNCCPPNPGHVDHSGYYCPPNMPHGTASFCNCMQHFYNCMCSYMQHFCHSCHGNRRKALRANSCCDNCCEGLCGSTPDWRCYCSHNRNTAGHLPPRQRANTCCDNCCEGLCGSTSDWRCHCTHNRHSAKQPSEDNLDPLDNIKIDLNSLFDFCKTHAVPDAENKAAPTIDLSAVFAFCDKAAESFKKQENINETKQRDQNGTEPQQNQNGTEPQQSQSGNEQQQNQNGNEQLQQSLRDDIGAELKSAFSYMKEKACAPLANFAANLCKNVTNQNKVNGQEPMEALKQVFQSMKDYMDKKQNIQTTTPPTPTNQENQAKEQRINRSNYNNPNNRAFQGNKVKPGAYKGKTILQHLVSNTFGEEEVANVHSNEMVFISLKK